MEEEKKRKTVGEINAELLIKAVDDQHCAVDQADEQLKNYEQKFLECLEDAKSKYGSNEDFYIVSIFQHDKLLTRVMKNPFVARRSCPTPHYDEAVYKYTASEDRIQFLWVLPDIKVANYLVNNYLTLRDDERQLADFVLKHLNNELLYTAMKLNNEFPDNEILKSFKPTVL